jgi:hypothetical protein
LEIEAQVKGHRVKFLLSSEHFGAMNWPIEHLGAHAIVYPGWAVKDHTRCAIQELSGEIPQRRVYAHLGWRQLGDDWVYLDAGGGIGRVGRVPGVEVSLPDSLSRYKLPDPPEGEQLRTAVRAALRLLDLTRSAGICTF